MDAAAWPVPWSWLLAAAVAAYATACFVFITLENRSPRSTFSWFFLFLLVPGIGLVIYVLFGRSWRAFAREHDALLQLVDGDQRRQLEEFAVRQEADLDVLRAQVQPAARKLLTQLWTGGRAPLTLSNRMEVLQDARAFYPRLMEDIDAARHSVHLCFYEWAADPYTESVKARLLERVREGVRVRILYDPVGSLSMLSRRYVREMNAGGAVMRPYSPLVRLQTISYRNHRKIAVIDGNAAYIGGLNMTQKHLTGPQGFTGWRDTQARVEGEAARLLQGSFAMQWFATTGEDLIEPEYFPPLAGRLGRLPIQVVTSGPDREWHVMRQLYFTLITSAERTVYIQSPFFILDESLAEALRSAAFSGVDVRVMIAPRGAEGQLAYRAGRTYANEMSHAGVRVYEYQGAYFHPKTVCIDSAICVVGSVNLDIRSFSINYESALVVYDEGVTRQLEAVFEADQAQCTVFSADRYAAQSVFTRFGDSLTRLASPLL
jgi:cardiolipin synthase